MSLERLLKLEEKIAYQEFQLGELDSVIQEFTKKLIHLERQVDELRQTKLLEVGPGDEKPPHY